MARLSKKEFAKKKQEEMRTTINEAMSNVASYKHNPDDIKEYLDFMAKMHDYSPRNQMLLENQYQGANGVASKKHFEDLGFKVNEEDRPLEVLAPVFKNFYQDENNKWKPQFKANKEEKEKIENGELKTSNKLSYYKLVEVYDIGQTNAKAEDFPKIFPNRPYAFDERELNEKYPNLKTAVQKFAEQKGFNVQDEVNTNRLGNAKGVYYHYSDDIRMRPNLSNGEYISTLNHEIAHGFLHKNNNKSTHVKEIEAEMTAFVTNKHFGLDTSEKSIDYMANWTQNLTKLEDKELISTVESVSKASRSIINGIEKEYENQQNIQGEIYITNLRFDNADQKDYFEYKYEDLKNMNGDLFVNEDYLAITLRDKEKSLTIPLYETLREKHDYERLVSISNPYDKKIDYEMRNIHELKNFSAEDYINHYYEKVIQSNKVSEIKMDNQLEIERLGKEGGIEETKMLKEQKKFTVSAINTAEDFLRTKSYEKASLPAGAGEDPRFIFDFQAEADKELYQKVGFTKLERQMMIENAQKINPQEHNSNIKKETFKDFKDDILNNSVKSKEELKDYSSEYQSNYQSLLIEYSDRALTNKTEQALKETEENKKVEKEYER